MDAPRRWISYDTFKLIIALILAVIIILLLLRAPASPPAVSGALPTSTEVSVSAALPSATSAAMLEPTSTATLAPSAPPTSTPSPQPLPSATLAPPATATAEPHATATAELQATATEAASPTVQPQTEAIDCPLALPPRLEVGMQARVTSNLNLRSSPGIETNWLRTNPVNTQLQVIGGPVCVPHGGGAYLWWNVQSPDGVAGWSAEGSLTGDFYFLEPIP